MRPVQICLTSQSSIIVFLLPGSIANSLVDIGSDQLDIGTDGRGAGSIVGLPQ